MSVTRPPARPKTFLVAAADAPQVWKDAAQYICLGSASTLPRKDATTIMQAVADLPSGGGYIALSPGNFAVVGTGTAADGAINVNKSNVTIAGQGTGISTILLDATQGTTSVTGIIRTDSSVPLINVTFRDLTIDGNRASCTGRNIGVYCGRVNEASDFHENIRFERIECRNCYAYALDPHERTKNLWVIDCWSHHNGGHLNGGDGITVDWVEGFVIRGCLFHDNTRHGINLVTGANDGRVEGCRCHHNGVQGIAIQKATTGTARDCTVLNCDVSYNADVGIYLNNCYRNRIIACTVYANVADGIRLQGAWDNVISGNTVYDNNTVNASGRAQIRLSYDTTDSLSSERNTITGNICRNDGGSGALTRGIYNQNDCNENVIANNIVSNHTANEIEVGGTGTDTVLVANNLIGAAAAGSLIPNPAATYTVFRLYDGTTVTYLAKRADGTVASQVDDTLTVSGLRSVLAATVADNVFWFFLGPFFAFIEDAAGTQDHFEATNYRGLRLEGFGHTVIANWRDDTQAGYDTTADVEPLGFTRCEDVVLRNLRIWAGGNRDANASSDALDFDGCRNVLVEDVSVERSRARGMVFDGGDTGAVATRSKIHRCEVRGIPLAPKLYASGTGSIVAQQYRYCLTFVDSVLGETPPSDVTSYVADGTSSVRVGIATGPAFSVTKGVTSRKLYRWSAAQPVWHLLTTIANNTATTYDDGATDASIAAGAAPPALGVPMIPNEGIKLLGCARHEVVHNAVNGTGDHGIQAVRKGTDATSNVPSDGHRIALNTVRHAGAGAASGGVAGIYVGGASDTKVIGNDVGPVANPTNKGYGISVQGLVGGVTARNTLDGNAIVDDRDANAPAGGSGMSNGIRIHVIGGGTAPSQTWLGPNPSLGATGGAVSDLAGLSTHVAIDATGTSTDNGNAAKTLVAGIDQVTQRWNTPLTAIRAVTLSTTGATNGAKFRVVREVSATGAFALNIGTGPLKALATASTWADVEFDGTAWRLVASGSL